jgi:hypothetical protein
VLDIEEFLLVRKLAIFSTSLSLFQGCLAGLRLGNAEAISKHAVSFWKTSFRGALNCVWAIILLENPQGILLLERESIMFSGISFYF